MGRFTEDGYRFFDTHEDIASVSDAKSDINDMIDYCSTFDNLLTNSPHYDLWINSPGSVRERRRKFLKWMGVGLDQRTTAKSVEVCSLRGDIGRIRESSGAVLKKAGDVEFNSARSIVTCLTNDNPDELEKLGSEVDFVCTDKNLDGVKESCADEMGPKGKIIEDSTLMATAEEHEIASPSTSSFHQRGLNKIEEPKDFVGVPKKVKKGWLRRLRTMACVMDRRRETEKLRHDYDGELLHYRLQRVKVHQSGKRIKELSGLYKGQDIQAHEGSVLTMKFSPDGKYLASAGEDGIVRLWQVLERERSNKLDIPEIDQSSIYSI